jgi:hypothetical protein
MRTRLTRSTGRIWVPALAVALLAACGPTEASRQQLTELTAQKDSLIQEVADQARFLSNVSAELAKVQVQGAALDVQSESPMEAQRDTIRQRIDQIVTRLNQSESQLVESRRRVRSLTRVSDSLRAAFTETIDNYEAMIADHRTTITQLNERIAELEATNVQLAQDTARLQGEVQRLENRSHTVYYVVGTKDELIERGIVREEGGARTLFILWKRGETLVPARDLDPSAFTAIDMRSVREIPLPEPDAEYRIASRHALELVDAPTDGNGKIRGAEALRITAPNQFWEPSKFLIIVRG